MRVYCTKKLQDFIGNVDLATSCDSKDIKISDWYAHLFFVQNRKCIVYDHRYAAELQSSHTPLR